MRKNGFYLVFIFFFIGFVGACSKQNPIIGKWESETIFAEFFANGEYVFSGDFLYQGTWNDLGDGNLFLTVGRHSLDCTYEIINNELTLFFGNENIINLKRR